MLSGRVAILMVDDREVGSLSPSGTTLAYPSLAFALNAEYACSHRLGEKPRGTPRGRQRRREKSPLWQVGR